MTENQFALELYKRYGTVTRARNCFLYTKKCVRITDMFLQNGRAILGWDAGSAFTHFKNMLSKGLTGSFISEDVSRLQKAVSALLESSRRLFYFSSKVDAIKAALSYAPSNTAVYLPWTFDSSVWQKTACVVLEPPFPWTDSLFILAINETLLSSDKEVSFANQVNFPFALEAGITRSIYNLIEQLPLRQEKNWFIYDSVLTKYWTRKGPYLFSKIPEEKYDSFVLHCLDCGIAVNPGYNVPSIVPFGADKGVFTKLKNSPFEF